MMDHPFLFFIGDFFVLFYEDFFEFAFIIKIAALNCDLRLVDVEFGVGFFVHGVINLDADGFVGSLCAGFFEIGLLNSSHLSVYCEW